MRSEIIVFHLQRLIIDSRLLNILCHFLKLLYALLQTPKSLLNHYIYLWRHLIYCHLYQVLFPILFILLKSNSQLNKVHFPHLLYFFLVTHSTVLLSYKILYKFTQQCEVYYILYLYLSFIVQLFLHFLYVHVFVFFLQLL